MHINSFQWRNGMNKLNEVIKYFNKQYKAQAEQNRTRRKLKKYYVDSKQDMRSNIAKTLDYIGIRIIIFFLTIILMLVQYNNLFISILSASLGTIAFHGIDIFVRNRRTQKIIYKRRKYFASQKVYKDIMNKDISELQEYITLVLNKSRFTIKSTEKINERNFLMDTSYKDIELMILFKKYSNETSVPLKEVMEFNRLLKKTENKKGIIISTSDFTKECQNYLEEKFLNKEITLIDKEKLLKIIDEAGLFPTVKEIDEYTVDRIEKQEKKIIAYREVFLAQSKIKSYIILSLFLLVWTRYTTFQLYYFFISIILMGLAALSIYSSIKKKSEVGKDFNFDELLGDK